ncbi:LysE family translocator [Enterobacter sp. SA187]|uniref:LysE family translocator n=1 Tax=Enterobacter sp. SA187 TaxID=1914861 RepID=UPI000AFACB91|nr:LysE family translocator [Enterobacter sp. SA187]
MMQQFLLVATAHFLALLSPGPDFFLVARTSIKAGWRHAAFVCLGIAVANGVFILAAFSGITLFRSGSAGFIAIQLAGCGYLLYVGQLFIRFAGASSLTGHKMTPEAALTEKTDLTDRWREFGMGFMSGILNPKNALFYVSLATLIGGAGTAPGLKVVYGVWMFSVVLLWDLLVAIFIGNDAVLRTFSKVLPAVERISGVILICLALSVIVINVLQLSR